MLAAFLNSERSETGANFCEISDVLQAGRIGALELFVNGQSFAAGFQRFVRPACLREHCANLAIEVCDIPACLEIIRIGGGEYFKSIQ